MAPATYRVIQTGIDGPGRHGRIGWLNVINIPAKVTAGLACYLLRQLHGDARPVHTRGRGYGFRPVGMN